VEHRELTLSDDSERIAQIVRILGASVNIDILRHLMEARRQEGDEGWRYLSEIAEALDEAPGTVGAAVQKLHPLLEERREKGRRYFRSRVEDLRIVMEVHPRDDIL
jgi:DNA-binding transcriptional ArsR family regulator